MENGSSTAATGWRRSFWALIVTQAQGAFSDNAYKFLLIFTLTAAAGLFGDCVFLAQIPLREKVCRDP